MYSDTEELLNKLSEMMPICPHQIKYLLTNHDSKDWLIPYKVYSKSIHFAWNKFSM